jgi:hypothetical protein
LPWIKKVKRAVKNLSKGFRKPPEIREYYLHGKLYVSFVSYVLGISERFPYEELPDYWLKVAGLI